MDVPISLGVALALGMSLVETVNHAEHAYFDSAIMLLFFLLCGRYLDHAMRRKTRAVAGNLAALKAEFAHRFDESGRSCASRPRRCKPATACWCGPASAFPPTAGVLTGASEIDESLVTGETARRAVVRRRSDPCGQHEFFRHADHEGDRGRRAAR